MPVIRFIALGIGKTLSKVFGLATMTFFGRMPSRDDDRIAFVGVASLTWLTMVLAAAWPALAELFIPFVDDEATARLIALLLAAVLPLAIGAVVATMHNNRSDRPKRVAGHVVSGYVYAAVIGVTVAAIVVTIPIIKTSYVMKRFSVVRLMVMIPVGTYEDVVAHLKSILADQGIRASEERPNPVVWLQFRLLGWILGRVFHRDIADDLRVLRGRRDGDWFEITVHAADISIIGNRSVVHELRALLADGLDERVVYLTWDDDSQALENCIRRCRDQLDKGEPIDPEEIDRIVAGLSRQKLDQEAWDAVRRLLYRLERDAERVRVSADQPRRPQQPL